MPNTTLSVYMNLPVPVPTVDPGPNWAFDVNSCFSILDSHTHAPGQGQQITPAGINITTDLSFGGNNGINFRSGRFTPQPGTINGGSDIGCVYVAAADLYYNDTSGNQVRLTQNGGVAGTPGSIGNLVFPASVTYVTGSQTFVFQSSTATAGNIDVGSVKIREVSANAKAITLSSPTSLANNYTLTFPGALPSSAASVQVDTSGNLSFASTNIPKVFRAISSSGQSIPDSVPTLVTWNITQFDRFNGFNGQTLFPGKSGYYQINAQVEFNSAGIGQRQTIVYVNGSTYNTLGNATNLYAAQVGGATIAFLPTDVSFIQIYAFQNSGSPLTVFPSSTGFNFFTVNYLGS